MPYLNQQFVTVGVARQSTKGTPAAAATFNHGLISGAGATLSPAHSPVATTAGVRAYNQVDRTNIKPGFSFDSKAYVKSVGMWLVASHGSLVDSGAGPYTHTVTASLTQTLPYVTFWGQTDSMWVQVRDAMVDTFELNFDENGVVTVKVDGFGTVPTIGTTPPTVTNSDLQGNYLSALGGSMKFDTLTGTPVAAVIRSGSYTLQNNINDLPDATNILPADTYPGNRSVTVKVVVDVQDTTVYRAIVGGSTSAVAMSQTPVYGSAEFNFVEYGGTGTLKTSTPRIAWTIDDPKADPKGGPVTLTLTGTVLAGVGVTDVTQVLINGITTY